MTRARLPAHLPTPWPALVVSGALFGLFGSGACVPDPGPASGDGDGDGDASDEPEPTPEAEPEPTDGGVDGGLPPIVHPECETNGCLRSVELIGTYPVEDIEAAVPAGVVVENGYAVWYITYWTGGFSAAATVTVPAFVEPPAGGFHVAVNNPGTVGVDDPCAPGWSVAGAGLAGYFGARGLVGVAIDYPGLGTPGTHPYLVLDVEARASLDGARAALNLTAREAVPMSGRLVIAGLSQGGHATLGAAALHSSYAPELDIRGFLAAAPAGLYLEHWADSMLLPGDQHVFTAMLVYAWGRYYAYGGAPVFQPAVLGQIDSWMSGWCLAPSLFSPDDLTLYDLIPEDPTALFTDDFRLAFIAEDLSGYPAYEAGWVQNRARPWSSQTAPLVIFQGTDDGVVPEAWTSEVVADLEAGGIEVDYRVVPGGTHLDVAFHYLAVEQSETEEALAWIRDRLE